MHRPTLLQERHRADVTRKSSTVVRSLGSLLSFSDYVLVLLAVPATVRSIIVHPMDLSGHQWVLESLNRSVPADAVEFTNCSLFSNRCNS